MLDPALAPTATEAGTGAAPAQPNPANPQPSAADLAAARRAEVRSRVLAGAHRPGTAQPAAAPVAAPPAATGQPAAAASPAETPGQPAAAPAADPTAEPNDPAAVLRRQEQHLRRQLATERASLQADFDTQRQQWQQRLTEADQFKQRIASAGRDPIALIDLIKSAGYTDADFEALGGLIYAHSPEGQKDPRRKDAARAALRDREQAGGLSKLEKELGDLRAELTRRDQQAATQTYLTQYTDTVAKAVDDKAPFAKAALAKNPERARQQLLATAARLYHESGPSDDLREEPKPAAVLAAYEAERAAELEFYGIDPKAIRGTGAAAPPPAQPATALAPPPGAPQPPKPNGRLSRDQLLAKIEERKRAATTQPR